jgi:2-methylisoborneol synthase
MHIPRLACPFPLEFDESAANEADRRIVEWMGEVGLLRGQQAELSSFRFGTFAALVHPRAASRDHLFFAAQNITALFGIDDHYCDEEVEGADPRRSPVRLAGVLPALEVSLPSFRDLPSELVTEGDPVVGAIQETFAHAARLGSPAQIGRLRREYITMCLAMAGESAWRVTGHTPTPWEYLTQRPFNGATACLAAIDITGGYELSAHDYDAPQVRALTLMASSLILHANDLYSAAKESVTHARGASLPELLAIHQGQTLQQGMAEVVRLHDRQMDAYLALESEVADCASSALSRYLADLRSWIRGSLEWHSLTGRYHRRPGRPTPAEHKSRS